MIMIIIAGDEIVEVNGTSMLGKAHEEALKIFKSAKKGFLTLVVRPFKDTTVPRCPSLSHPPSCLSPEHDDGIGSIGSEGLDSTTCPTEWSTSCIRLDFNTGMRMGLRFKPALPPFMGYMEVC